MERFERLWLESCWCWEFGKCVGPIGPPPIVPGRLGARTNFPPHIGVNEGNGMGYLKLVILVLAYALISPAFAQTCCPAGCAPEADRCVTTGPLWTRCIPIACADGSRKPSGDSAAGPRQQRKSAVLARPLRTVRAYVAPRQ